MKTKRLSHRKSLKSRAVEHEAMLIFATLFLMQSKLEKEGLNYNVGEIMTEMGDSRISLKGLRAPEVYAELKARGQVVPGFTTWLDSQQ